MVKSKSVGMGKKMTEAIFPARKGDFAGLKAPGVAPGAKNGASGAYTLGGASQGEETATGTSIFDPVLCELAYKWFCPPGGHILDPFAGGSVRGIVASHLGYRYTGIELRGEQVTANREQLHIARDPHPTWHQGDSREAASICAGLQADFVFTCPPYADLEIYSDDPRDISTLVYDEFIAAFAQIMWTSASLLKDDRFICVVVGDARDKRGLYYGFPADTVKLMQDGGFPLYNEAIIITAVGSFPLRIGNQFTNRRKLGKTHQNILVFVKGDPKRAAAAIGGNGE
jgi:DNA modification methylase